ncbi:oligopeptide transport system permease OppB [Corynebacterium ulcerans]|uniref:Oligopeptide transport system permease OppB n=2 Tax=Corynebacterium ulcerans TaxID=65058 RepID=A0ABD7MVC9_CORUL|nr:oligopeptide transport system permease OppB [Corynebacterium ulcerans]SQG53156.1 oligopeptide transport system permease OppB [Corynebacterium ulcerans]SQH03238.1 oligopeptide transport system permease OppB [Corynebacterium ulcerans]
MLLPGRRDNLDGIGVMVGLRLLVIACTTVVVTFIMFALAALSPFDPLAHYLGAEYGDYTDDERARIAASLGVDRPWWQQWLQWWADVLRGDLGWSRVYNKSVADVIWERLPWTIVLSSVGLLLMLVIAAILGVWAARRPGGSVDRSVNAIGVFVAATPSYIYALGAVLFFGVFLHVIPVGGASRVGDVPSLLTVGPYLIAPAIVLAVSQLSWPLLTMQQSTLEASQSPAVANARLRGLSEKTILVRHVLPLSLMPLITLIGARLGELVVGAVIVETVFSWPGLAQATVESAIAVDFPLLAFTTAATTVVVMLGSLASDVSYMIIDPRVSDV